ncbi:hypothetical protein EYF80_020182 [Liparis tanakae]|uniref:Uncharacterized protein n=1 Tax=Liparis tanakae TaxID=230148 RepID=A0A4Z2HV15_9TELE|nr:hypothetical protein EYF80_020182 [Liparis tanakae]
MPPSSAGLDHSRLMEVLVESDTQTTDGAQGISFGSAALIGIEMLLGAPTPASFTAMTRNSYSISSVRPISSLHSVLATVGTISVPDEQGAGSSNIDDVHHLFGDLHTVSEPDDLGNRASSDGSSGSRSALQRNSQLHILASLHDIVVARHCATSVGTWLAPFHHHGGLGNNRGRTSSKMVAHNRTATINDRLIPNHQHVRLSGQLHYSRFRPSSDGNKQTQSSTCTDRYHLSEISIQLDLWCFNPMVAQDRAASILDRFVPLNNLFWVNIKVWLLYFVLGNNRSSNIGMLTNSNFVDGTYSKLLHNFKLGLLDTCWRCGHCPFLSRGICGDCLGNRDSRCRPSLDWHKEANGAASSDDKGSSQLNIQLQIGFSWTLHNLKQLLSFSRFTCSLSIYSANPEVVFCTSFQAGNNKLCDPKWM